MEVLCFGIAKDIIGSTSYTVKHPVYSVHELRQHLNSEFPKFKDYTAYRIAVNQSFAGEQDAIKSSDEIAIIPPVSGG